MSNITPNPDDFSQTHNDDGTEAIPPSTANSEGTALLNIDPGEPRATPVLSATEEFVVDRHTTQELQSPDATRLDGDVTAAFVLRGGDSTQEFIPGKEQQPTDWVSGGATDRVNSSPGGQADTAGKSLVPPICGRYHLKRFHAKGGMGEIWFAEDPGIGRSVALKRMRPKKGLNPHRFLVEAQITGQLEHPGIVPVHELATNQEGHLFYAMKFVHGKTLQRVIKDHYASQAGSSNSQVEQLRLLHIFISLCQTVAYAHSRGVLHRDIKPENVMLGSFGETLLLDWGLAKVIGQTGTVPDFTDQPTQADTSSVHLPESQDGTRTQFGSILGSVPYMSPEVASGMTHSVDERSDVYLLGATLYEILTGRQPREGTDVMETIKRAQKEPPPPPRKINPAVPKRLNAICVKAMAHRVEDRYPSALLLAEDVQRYVAGEPVSAYQENTLERIGRWAKRNRHVIARSLGGVLLLSLLGFGVIKLRDADLQKAKALREASELREQEQARQDVKEFLRQADEARFYAATTDPVSENSPYFDPKEGEKRSRAALELASQWGDNLENLPAIIERDPLKAELFETVLVLAQTISERSSEGNSRTAAKETLELLEKYANFQQDSIAFHRLKAWALNHLDDKKGAEQSLNQAENPKNLTTALDHFLLGEQHRTQAYRRAPKQETTQKAWKSDPKDLEKAIEEYRLSLALEPNYYWSQLQLGRCYLGLGRLSEAVEALGTCVALRPNAPWGYTIRGLALIQQKRYLEAERDLNLALKYNPDSRHARLTRGISRWFQKDNDLALEDFEAVLLAPNEKRLIEGAYYRGILYLQAGEIKKALVDFDSVISERSHFRPAYQYRALIHIARGDVPEAIKDLDLYLEIQPGADSESWEAHARRGKLLRYLFTERINAQGQNQSAQAISNLALNQLKKAVKLGGNQSNDVFDDLGAMLDLSGKSGEALIAYSQGITLAPKNVRILLKRGWLYELSSDHDKAQADFAAALAIDPNNAEGHTGLGYVRAMRKGASEALSEANLALLNGSEDYLILHNIACIYGALSQTGDSQALAHQNAAIALLNRAVKLWRKSPGTGPNEIELIREDPAFKGLKERSDFKKLYMLKEY